MKKTGKHGKHAKEQPKTSIDRRMTVDKEIVDELLLVCGVIGTTTQEDENGEESFIPVTDCLNWLQDLQRALRRDDDMFRPISLLMGKYKVVEQKLLPLVMTCRYDSAIVLTVVKILVILTKPLAENTKRAGKMIIDTSKGGKVSAVVQEQIKLRNNALEQAELLLEYKKVFAHHPSHHHHQQQREGEEPSGMTGLLSIFVSLLAEPLSRSGAARTELDHLTIELVLHLFRNLLSIDVLMNTSADVSRKAAELHDALIYLFDKELVLEILLVLGQNMESRENAQYNLLVMELLHHLLKSQDPASVAHFGKGGKAKETARASNTTGRRPLLDSRLKLEQSQKQALRGSRHGHFGGLWRSKGRDGKTSYVTASQTGTSRWSKDSAAQTVRKNRMAEPFIGSSRTLLWNSSKQAAHDTPSSQRAKASLHQFCERFLEDCYGPTMKSLKNEFRRDSVRLEEGDKVVFFRVVWFFCQWWRLSQKDKKQDLGSLIFTMDVFTFILVLTATDTFHQHKKYSRLAQAVALYSEMTHLLFIMYQSKDSTESLMAKGLLDRLFYCSEPLDRLPKLLRNWVPGVTTRDYLCDIVELTHTSLKILEASAKYSRAQDPTAKGKIAEMNSSAARFDVMSYFLKKIATSQTIYMYFQLLRYYKDNSKIVNHRIVAMLLRIGRTELLGAQVQDSNVPINPLGIRRTTFEPILFNIHLFLTVEKIVNDISIKDLEEYKFLIQFCRSYITRFQAAAKGNPMLFVECLFRHAAPQRFCEQFENRYVSEELRMIAERELLMADNMRMMGEDNNNDSEDEDELEMEETDELVFEEKSAPKQKNALLDSDSEDEDGKEEDTDAVQDKTQAEQTEEPPQGQKRKVQRIEDDDSDMEVPMPPSKRQEIATN